MYEDLNTITHSARSIEQEITSMGVLRYFEPNVVSVIQTGASQEGLGAVFLQQGQPVCYKHRKRLKQHRERNPESFNSITFWEALHSKH